MTFSGITKFIVVRYPLPIIFPLTVSFSVTSYRNSVTSAYASFASRWSSTKSLLSSFFLSNHNSALTVLCTRLFSCTLLNPANFLSRFFAIHAVKVCNIFVMCKKSFATARKYSLSVVLKKFSNSILSSFIIVTSMNFLDSAS